VTYVLINIPFLLLAVAVLVVARVRTGRPAWGPLAGTMLVLLLLTAVFDNLMIRAGLVAYDDAQRLGWSIGVAPVEDFAYTVLAVLMLPATWCLLARREESRRGAEGDLRARPGAGQG
jgi:lycopene cyclase domain-containing protein